MALNKGLDLNPKEEEQEAGLHTAPPILWNYAWAMKPCALVCNLWWL